MLIFSPSLLRLRNFRCLGIAALLNAAGMLGETVVLGWLTLELTNSPFLVGVAMGARSIPLFFVGIPAGALADRFSRHRMLMVTATGQALTAATLGVLTLLNSASLSVILLLTFVAGTIRGIEQAARQSYAHDVTGPAELMNGLAMLGVAMRTGWLLGSLVAGWVIAHLGSGAAYLAVAAAYLAGGIALFPASAPSGTTVRATESLWHQIVDFATALGRDRLLLVLMVLTSGAEILGFSHQALLPSLARDILHVGAEGLGALNAARSIGGILGLFAVSLRRPIEGGGALFLGVLVFFGSSLIALGLAPHFLGLAAVVVVLILANAAGGISDLLAQSLMQTSVPARLRGRAGGAWVVAIGLAPLGQLQIGALASLFGVSLAFGASGLGLVALAGATAFFVPRMRRL
ncbi:MAG TPA: MFS transporter [Candidatus Methylomirabilis sp.]|nr:MFS transporter [Candidatus Methylomirabilis sp.]